MLVSTHDIQQARSFDLVLALNHTQIAFGPPDEALTPELLPRTYGGELIVLEGGEHAIASSTTTTERWTALIEILTDPFSQGITQRALIELIILGVVCGPFGVWIVLFRQSYAAESLAHSMLPGLVVAALIGAPLGLGAAAASPSPPSHLLRRRARARQRRLAVAVR